MGKKGSKLSHAAHIKRHTEGTSNELSFSVLDAAKNQADAVEGKDGKAKAPRFGGIALFSFPGKKKVSTPSKEDALPISEGAAGTGMPGGGSAAAAVAVAGANPLPASGFGTSASEAEVGRRKALRRKRRRSTKVAIAVVAVVAVAAASVYFYIDYNNNQNHVVVLKQSLERITRTDEVLTEMDKLVNDPNDTTAKYTADQVIEKLPQARQQLNEAEALANRASAGISDGKDKEALSQVQADIEARREMITSGEKLLQADDQVVDASEKVKAAWEQVLNADAMTRDAASLIAHTTNENIAASKAKDEEALSLFRNALYAMEEVSSYEIAPELDTQTAYIEKRIEATKHAIASDDALLAQNKELADAENEAYNTADAEAADIARQLSSDPTKPLLEAYEKNVDAPRKSYTQARSKAGVADAFLRDYLGT